MREQDVHQIALRATPHNGAPFDWHTRAAHERCRAAVLGLRDMTTSSLRIDLDGIT